MTSRAVATNRIPCNGPIFLFSYFPICPIFSLFSSRLPAAAPLGCPCLCICRTRMQPPSLFPIRVLLCVCRTALHSPTPRPLISPRLNWCPGGESSSIGLMTLILSGFLYAYWRYIFPILNPLYSQLKCNAYYLHLNSFVLNADDRCPRQRFSRSITASIFYRSISNFYFLILNPLYVQLKLNAYLQGLKAINLSGGRQVPHPN